MFDSNALKYYIHKDFDIPFDEKGSTYGAVKLVQWIKEGNEPDIEKAKVEIRKIYVTKEGENLGKGFTFSTKEGPHELTVGLIKAGFGDTKDILREVRKRDDFLEAASHVNDDDDASSGNGEMFDMRDLLLGIEDESEDE